MTREEIPASQTETAATMAETSGEGMTLDTRTTVDSEKDSKGTRTILATTGTGEEVILDKIRGDTETTTITTEDRWEAGRALVGRNRGK